jgi:hypothetical protein
MLQNDKIPESLCRYCGASNAKRVSCRTQYAEPSVTYWDLLQAQDGGLTPKRDVHEDPNPDPVLCERCAEDYTQYWDEMWQQYYTDRL